jgi:hypothetical protein
MERKPGAWLAIGGSVLLMGLAALWPESGVGGVAQQQQAPPQADTQAVPLGLEDPAAYIPADNPQTAKKI